jgi:hypothetical protein
MQIFRICQKKVVHVDELWDAADTLGWVFSAAQERVALLECELEYTLTSPSLDLLFPATFQQQKVEVAAQFKTYAHGLFSYLYEPHGLWDAKTVLAQEFPDYPYDDALEAQDIDMQKVLNYPLGIEKLDFAAYNAEPAVSTLKSTGRPSSALKALLGSWNGFTYSPASSIVPSSGMISMELLANGSRRFQASSRSNMSDFSISGECSGESSETVKFTFKQTFPTRFPTQYFSGTWSRATQSLSGTWGAEDEPRTHDGVFIFKRIIPEYMCFFPAPSVMKANKPRSLWAFAIASVRYFIRKENWSWAFFKQRTHNRKRFVELYIRSTRFGRPLNRAEEEELGLIKKSFTTADRLVTPKQD